MFWRSLWEISLEPLPGQSKGCFFLQIFWIYLYWPSTGNHHPWLAQGHQGCAGTLWEGSACFSTSKMPIFGSIFCQFWSILKAGMLPSTETPCPPLEENWLWMSSSGSGKEGGSKIELRLEKTSKFMESGMGSWGQGALWRCLSPPLDTTGLGWCYPGGDTPRLIWRERRSAEGEPQGAAGGESMVGTTSLGGRQRFFDPILVVENFSPTWSEAHHLSVSFFTFLKFKFLKIFKVLFWKTVLVSLLLLGLIDYCVL